MKLEWNKKYTTIAIYCFLTAAAIICFLLCIVYFDNVKSTLASLLNILKPILYGLVIAYLLNPVEKFVKNLLDKLSAKAKKPHPKLMKALSIFVTYLFLLLLITGFFLLLIPQIGRSLSDLSAKLSELYPKVIAFINERFESAELDSEAFGFGLLPKADDDIMSFVNKTFDVLKDVYPQVTQILGNVTSELKNILLGIFISIYMLAGKNTFRRQFKKLLYAVFAQDRVQRILFSLRETDRLFGGFITGKILDSAIIGLMCFIVMSIFSMPYAALISLIVGVTNIIPLFGPFIGGIPSAILILIASPAKALWFVVMILVLQQVDGNFIGPKILGDTTGLPSFWIVFSLIVFGGLWGVVGMIVAIPFFALIYDFIKRRCEASLGKKGLPKSSDEY